MPIRGPAKPPFLLKKSKGIIARGGEVMAPGVGGNARFVWRATQYGKRSLSSPRPMMIAGRTTVTRPGMRRCASFSAYALAWPYGNDAPTGEFSRVSTGASDVIGTRV